MNGTPSLFVGITSWNSAVFLDHTIKAVKRTSPLSTRIVVHDNESEDESVDIALENDVEIIVNRCNQANALNQLFDLSRSEVTLLIHADVILLSESWLDVCLRYLDENVVLVSPEDIGCGPFTRPWGKDKPESSFLLMDTRRVRGARPWFWRQRFKLRLPFRAIDFFGEHVTHRVPNMLHKNGLGWKPMGIHTSPETNDPIYQPPFDPLYWKEAFAHLRYGLGNFYSLDGVVTHYHNWFERVLSSDMRVDFESTDTFPEEDGLPVAYIKEYTRRFLLDLEMDELVIPATDGE